MDKRGTLLIENVIFIILNLLFLTVLVLFLMKSGSGAIVLEQTYSKQIAVLVDSAKPGMLMKIDMEKGKELAEDNGIDFKDVIKIDENIVTVKLSDRGGYSYSFFNDVDIGQPYPDEDDNGVYVFIVDAKGDKK